MKIQEGKGFTQMLIDMEDDKYKTFDKHENKYKNRFKVACVVVVVCYMYAWIAKIFVLIPLY